MGLFHRRKQVNDKVRRSKRLPSVIASSHKEGVTSTLVIGTQMSAASPPVTSISRKAAIPAFGSPNSPKTPADHRPQEGPQHSQQHAGGSLDVALTQQFSPWRGELTLSSSPEANIGTQTQVVETQSPPFTFPAITTKVQGSDSSHTTHGAHAAADGNDERVASFSPPPPTEPVFPRRPLVTQHYNYSPSRLPSPKRGGRGRGTR